MIINTQELYRTLDISCVKQMHTYEELKNICEIALKNNFKAVFVMPSLLPYIVPLLAHQTEVSPGSVIGFPSGADTTESKIRQTSELYQMGCKEFDMVMNLSYLKNREYGKIIKEIKAIKNELASCCLKVIIEAPLLNDEELKHACDTVISGNADYLKTATGWAGKTDFVTVQKIQTITQGSIKLKAAGGIDSREKIEQMHDIGCSRFGIGMGTWHKLK